MGIATLTIEPASGSQHQQILNKGVAVTGGPYTFTLLENGQVNVRSTDVNDNLVLNRASRWIVSKNNTTVPLAHISDVPDWSCIECLTVLDWNEFLVAMDVLYRRI